MYSELYGLKRYNALSCQFEIEATEDINTCRTRSLSYVQRARSGAEKIDFALCRLYTVWITIHAQDKVVSSSRVSFQ